MSRKTVRYTVDIHHDPKHGYEAEVLDLPGCFAAGSTMEELHAALDEAIGFYLSSEGARVTVHRLEDGELQEKRRFELCYA